MGISCGGICHRYRATKPHNSGRIVQAKKGVTLAAYSFTGMGCIVRVVDID